MKKFLCIFVMLMAQLSGCANTQSGKGFDLVRDDEYAEALPHLERAAKEDGSKSAAVMVSFVYLSDYQVPRNIEKAKEYYELSLALDYNRWNQHVDYFAPLTNAGVMLYDDDAENDSDATDILRGQRYSEFPFALGLLAKAYAFGKGVDKNVKISKLLFERAVTHDSEVYSAGLYAWWLAVHPDKAFRDGALASELMDDVMADDEASKRANNLDTLAAVQAENGYFADAVETQKRAIARLDKEKEDYPEYMVAKTWYECRLKSYEQEMPLHYELHHTPFVGTGGGDPCVWNRDGHP